MTHPYFDLDYIISLLKKAGLLDEKGAMGLLKRHFSQHKAPVDVVQWVDSLKIEKAGSQGQHGVIEEADILALIAADRDWPFMRLDPLKLDLDVVTKTFPASFAKRRLVLPVSWEDGELLIACYDPMDLELMEDLEKAHQAKMRLHVAPRRDIERIISEFFDFKQSIRAAEHSLKAPLVDISNLEQYVKLSSPDAAASDKYIQKAVDHLFQYALDQRASDIHIEPKRGDSCVRFRIDGVLHVVYRLPKVVHEAVCTRIKTLSRLDIAEKRRPQDGRLKLEWKGQNAEVRVSTVPVAFGEKVVLRLQSANILFSDLGALGLSDRDLDEYKGWLNHTHGIILITGPTGSGKSTTLYSTLRHLSSPEVNIITVEDPIEMVYDDFNQIAVQPQIDVTFSTILRNILRQDPDILMIGEIRDGETARYAVQAALTGHLVFSTLHTNDAVGAVTRLKDLGLEPYLISSTLLGVVAQRLVRMICPHCKEIYDVPAVMLQPLWQALKGDTYRIARGRGCSRCRNTGYWGRIGIYEVFSASEAIRMMIHAGKSDIELKAQALKEGMMPLKYDGLQKVLRHITSLDEVMRVASS
ncbi:MAG: GspE/PulE family protein [Dissulfurimicrobium sp.]|uniref:GspE/PulE family protein n=1 Tax=Dissulfurimicrobium sp. TaxID=2022436 RepID=UPI00404B62B9